MGFWSTLASIGTAAIPGIGPFIAPFVGAGLGALENRNSGSGGTVPSGGSTNTSGSINELLSQTSSPGSSQAQNYYSRILGGDRDSLEELVRPQVSTILSQYDNAAKAAAELGPRGGGRTEQLAELPFKKVAAYGQAVSGARNGAADKLGQLELGDKSIQNSRLATLLGAKNAEGQLGLGQQELDFKKSQANNANYSALGNSIGTILTDILKKKKTSKGSGAGNDLSSSFSFLGGGSGGNGGSSNPFSFLGGGGGND